LAKALISPLKATEFCPPAAQLVNESWLNVNVNVPPFFHPLRVSEDFAFNASSLSVT
jgi:hypothetical protein